MKKERTVQIVLNLPEGMRDWYRRQAEQIGIHLASHIKVIMHQKMIEEMENERHSEKS